MKKILVLMFIFNAMLSAQGLFEFKGVVRDSLTGRPLEGANLVFEGKVAGTKTDGSGRFSLRAQAKFPQKVKISYVGYKTKKIAVSSQNTGVTVLLSPGCLSAQEVVVSALGSKDGSPVAYTDMGRDEIKEKNQGQEIPLLISDIPGVYSYSLTGSQAGYSEIRIRGFDPTRVAVTLNSVPLNDPEDHVAYFYDIPDLTNSVSGIQVQRGVGSSLYGSSAIGGSVSLQTESNPLESGITLSTSLGSYNSKKYSLSFNSGLVSDRYSFYGRFSKVTSEGYRDDSYLRAWSYFLSANRYDGNFKTTFNAFGGPVESHFAWTGITKEDMAVNRRMNYDGPEFNNGFKDNSDNFLQNHYQLLNEWQAFPSLSLMSSLYIIKGDGYYETYKAQASYAKYGMESASLSGRTDLLRRKCVDKVEYGWAPKAQFTSGPSTLILGGNLDIFASYHFGQLRWVKDPPEDLRANQEFEVYYSRKNSFSLYAQEELALSEKLSLMADLQYKHIYYNLAQRQMNPYPGYCYWIQYNFLTPRVGINYKIMDDFSIFGNFSMAKREPKDSDIYDASSLDTPPEFKMVNGFYDFSAPAIDPETVYDYEIGLKKRIALTEFTLNLYRMNFSHEIVATGRVLDDGRIVYGNADKSVHSGIELAAKTDTFAGFSFSGNLSLSDNHFKSYSEPVSDDKGKITYCDRSGNSISCFPDRMLNLRLDYRISALRISYYTRYAGIQYLDNSESSALSVDPYWVSSAAIALDTGELLSFKNLRLAFNVNNIFNKLYCTTGSVDGSTAYYIPGAERNCSFSIEAEL